MFFPTSLASLLPLSYLSYQICKVFIYFSKWNKGVQAASYIDKLTISGGGQTTAETCGRHLDISVLAVEHLCLNRVYGVAHATFEDTHTDKKNWGTIV
jgi:hypothetical protein